MAPASLIDGALLDPFQASDENRVKEANRRHELVMTYRSLLDQGVSGKKAAELMGEDHVSLWRYNRAFEAEGYNGLLPQTHKCGRKSMVEKLRDLLGDAEVDKLLAQIKGINLDVESTTAALRSFAQSDACPEELARVILDPTRCSKHALPPSLRKAVKVNANVRQAHRGPRKLSLGGMWTPRKVDILPGDIFSADDTTPIWAWWVPWIECEEYPFGVKLLQGQFIPIIDVASQCVVTYALIAREKSSYRACDIWALFGHTFDVVGLPRLGFQLERGSWEANLIAGQEIEYRDDEMTLSRRVGGLRQLPTQLTDWHRNKLGEAAGAFPKTLQTWTSFLPKSKAVEGWFNRNQALEGTLYGALGRDQMRNQFEKTKALYEACKRPASKMDPRQYFLSGTEIAARINKIVDYINHEPIEGEVFHGVPKLAFDNTVREFPLYRMEEDKAYLYRRDWKVLQITRGWARVRLTDPITSRRYSLFYQNAAVFAGMEGEEVVVYYDRENFEAPAQIHLARNGEFVCEAQYFDRTGSFLEGDLTGHDIRKQWRNAVMSIYGTLVNHAPSRQLPPEIAARREAAKRATGILPATGNDAAGTRQDAGGTIAQRGQVPAPAPARKSLQPQYSEEEEQQRSAQLRRDAELANRLRALTEHMD